MQYKNILVLAPHTDDGELGCGATLAKFIEEGSNVVYVAFSTAEESVPDGFPKDILKIELFAATKKLGIPQENVIVFNFAVRKLNYARQEILEELVKIRNMHHWDLILMPSLRDIHQDHQVVAQEGLRAFKNTNIWSYELIWNNLDFQTIGFVKLEEKHVTSKCHALKEYKSQGFRNYMSEEFIFSLAIARGVQINAEYAEAFEIVRSVYS